LPSLSSLPSLPSLSADSPSASRLASWAEALLGVSRELLREQSTVSSLSFAASIAPLRRKGKGAPLLSAHDLPPPARQRDACPQNERQFHLAELGLERAFLSRSRSADLRLRRRSASSPRTLGTPSLSSL
ncbi:hypothetical protein TGPRC2_422970, partial [Toxoplasma gondii TgCatPRC2]